jgi:hypothetical protein
MMGISVEELEQMGIHERPEVVDNLLHEALRELLIGRLAPDPRRSLSATDAEALRRAGFDLKPRDLGVNSPMFLGAKQYAAMVASSLTVAEAAAKVHLDGSRIRQRLAARTVYGIRLAHEWRIPIFQFDGDCLIAGLGDILPHLSRDVHPLTVQNFFLNPNPDLVIGEDETAISPREWLLSGGSPTTVAELIAELGTAP